MRHLGIGFAPLYTAGSDPERIDALIEPRGESGVALRAFASISTPVLLTAPDCIGERRRQASPARTRAAILRAMCELTSVAVYRRRIGASIERVWENVRDWEHLPWLHRESFASVALEEAGEFGWRARVGLRADSAQGVLLEVVAESERRYVARTLEGPGAATEIWTRLDPVDARRTDIEVEFLVPGVAAARRAALGDGYVALYTRLWDQDVAMMQRRSWLLDAPRGATAAREPVDLGIAAELETRLPLRVAFGGRLVVVARDRGEFVAYDALCPHALGPLDAAEIVDGRVVCPWHGKSFDVRSGRGCDAGNRLRLAPAPRVEVAGGRVRLVPA